MPQTDYQKGYYACERKYKAILHEKEEEIKNKPLDINAFYPFNLMQDIVEDKNASSITNYDFSAKQIKCCIEKNLSEREIKMLELKYARRMNYEEIGSEFGLTRERVRQIVDNAMDKLKSTVSLIEMAVVPLKDYLNEVSKNQKIKGSQGEVGNETLLNISIEELGLSVRAYNCLDKAGLNTIGDIVNYNRPLDNIGNIGSKSAYEITKKLSDLGLTLYGNR